MDGRVLSKAMIVAVAVPLILLLLSGAYIAYLRKENRELKQELNLVSQSYGKMRREYEDKERIYKAQDEKLKLLEEAGVLDDYITLWK